MVYIKFVQFFVFNNTSVKWLERNKMMKLEFFELPSTDPKYILNQYRTWVKRQNNTKFSSKLYPFLS